MNEEIKAATRFGELFGFAGLIAIGFFLLFAWLLKRWVDNFLEMQKLKTTAEIEIQADLAVAQTNSYLKHTQVAEGVGKAINQIEKIAAQNSRAVELLATTNEVCASLIHKTSDSSQAVHKAIRESLYVAADMCSDNPDIQRRLRMIADELKK